MSVLRARRKNGLRTPRFLARFRRSTEAARFAGNSVTLLPHGGEFMKALLREIQSSRSLITLEFYIFRHDSVGAAIADALADAASRGVVVCLLYDYVGSIETPASFFRGLQDRGVRCIPFNPFSFRKTLRRMDRRNHRKIAVFDGETALLGGVNVGEEYAGFGENTWRWRDMGIDLKGPAVSELQRMFWEIWRDEGGDVPAQAGTALGGEPCGTDQVIVISGSPLHRSSYIRSAYRMALAGATESVRILNPYFVPGPRVVRSLLRAAARGVRVQMILPGESDVPLVNIVSRGYFHPLLKAGVEIYRRQGTILHAKLMLIDGCWTVIGSANLDMRSFHRNYEVNVIVDSGEFAREVEQLFEEDLAQSVRVTMEEHQARPWLIRFLEFAFAPLGRFL